MPPEIIAALIAGLATVVGPVIVHYIRKRDVSEETSTLEAKESPPDYPPSRQDAKGATTSDRKVRKAEQSKILSRGDVSPSANKSSRAPTLVADKRNSRSRTSRRAAIKTPVLRGGNTQYELNKVELEVPEDFSSGGLSCVYFLNGEIGWAAGSAGNLFRTCDGGRHWVQFRRETRALIKDIFFFDETTGWSVATDGLWKTEDGGEHWEPTVGLEQPTAAKKFLPKDLERRIHELGLEDAAGVLWGAKGAPNRTCEGIFNKLFFFGEVGWAIGGSGSTLKTHNRGWTWEYGRLEQDFHLRDIYFLDENSGWIVGDNGRILGTDDGGLTWKDLRIVDTRTALSSIWMLNKRVGWAVGWSGQILFTEDGGYRWKRKHFKLTGAHLTTIAFKNDSEGWIVGAGGTVLHTTSSGEKWTLNDFSKEIRGQFNDLYVLPESLSGSGLHGYAVGGDGWMLKISHGDS